MPYKQAFFEDEFMQHCYITFSSYYIIVTSEIKSSAYNGKPFLKFSSIGNTYNTLAAVIFQSAKCSNNSPVVGALAWQSKGFRFNAQYAQFCCCCFLEQGTLLQLLTCATMNLVTSLPKEWHRYGDPLVRGYRKKKFKKKQQDKYRFR